MSLDAQPSEIESALKLAADLCTLGKWVEACPYFRAGERPSQRSYQLQRGRNGWRCKVFGMLLESKHRGADAADAIAKAAAWVREQAVSGG